MTPSIPWNGDFGVKCNGGFPISFRIQHILKVSDFFWNKV